MPVWVSTDAAVDHNKDGKQRRHISDTCPIYLAEVPASSRSALKGRPNTEKLQERTVRCEHDQCWLDWEKTVKAKKTRGTGGTKTSQKAAATVPATTVGGKAADLAARAKAGRQKPKATAQAAVAA